MTLTNTGNVGIGIPSPATKLQVVGGTDLSAGGNGYIVAGAAAAKNLAIDENEIRARNNANASDLLLNSNGGNVIMNNTATKLGIGISAPVADLHVFHNGGSQTNGFRLQNQNNPNHLWNFYTQNAGNLELSVDTNHTVGAFDRVSGIYTAVSDRRVKKDIEESPDILDKVLTLHVLKYHFLENETSDHKYYGLIAQDVEKIFPEVVQHNYYDGISGDFYTMDHSAFGILAIKALQEQQQKLKQQDEEIVKLKNRLEKLENILNAISKDTGHNQPGASLQ